MSNIAWNDYEKSDYSVSRGGLVGQSGDMPPELYNKKMEQTCMYEREDQLDDFFRSTLKDRTTDAPVLAQDLPRETQDMVRSEVLNLRHSAARTPAEPIHPDLFLGFTDRDSRGYHNSGPDFKLYAEQSKARGKFKDFVSDHASDWTIPEGTRSEARVIADLRKTIIPTKNRMKIFDTSIDNRSTPWGGIKTQKSGVAKTTQDGTILNLNDAQAPGQRKDFTTIKSDIIKIGWRQTGDHKFSVAQYGFTTSKQRKVNVQESQYKSEESRKYVTTPDELKNRLTNKILKEVNRSKNIETYKKDMQNDFEISKSNKNTIGKIASNLSTLQQNTVQTADVKDLGYKGNNNKNVKVKEPISHGAVLVDKEIFKKVEEAKNVSFVKKTDPLSRRDVNTEEGKVKLPGNEVQVAVYSRKAPNNIEHLPVKMEHDIVESVYEPLYKQNHQRQAIMNKDFTEQDLDIDPRADKIFNSFKKGSGYSQGIRSNIDEEREDDNVNDSTFYTKKMRGRCSV